MKEIVLIMAHTPTYEKQKMLSNLVDFLLSKNYKIAIASHTPIPQNLIERVDYFFYEKENRTVYDPKLTYWSYYLSGNLKFEYKSIGAMSTHVLAIFSMFFSSLQFLKHLGYRIVHHIEYDSILNDCEFFKKNLNHLEDYDAVLYYSENNGNKGWSIYGPFFSFNLERIKIPEFDEFKILKDFEVALSTKFQLAAETVLYEYLFFNTNNLWIDINTIGNSFNLSESAYVSNTCNFHIYDGTVHFFSSNESNTSKEILIIIDGKVTSSFTQHPGNWCWYSTNKKIEEIKNIKLFINNQILKDFDLGKNEDLDYITKWSKVSIQY